MVGLPRDCSLGTAPSSFPRSGPSTGPRASQSEDPGGARLYRVPRGRESLRRRPPPGRGAAQWTTTSTGSWPRCARTSPSTARRSPSSPPPVAPTACLVPAALRRPGRAHGRGGRARRRCGRWRDRAARCPPRAEVLHRSGRCRCGATRWSGSSCPRDPTSTTGWWAESPRWSWMAGGGLGILKSITRCGAAWVEGAADPGSPGTAGRDRASL